jgi:hypothetical protein
MRRPCLGVLGSGVLALLAGACATSYHERGPLFGGVDSIQVSETSYRITVSGNQRTSSERIEDFVLLRASEIALARGYKGFVINQERDQSRTTQVTIPSGPIYSGTSIAPYSLPITQTIVEPGTTAFITLVHEGGMDARITYGSLGPRYGLQ